MGRSRALPYSSSSSHEFDLNQSRSKRKRNTESIEAATAAGENLSQLNNALYHCNYCNKDISGVVRVKCVVCSDFDLCVECFSVGAELNPHKCSHPYRVMDNLSFPLMCADWNADEEILLLEAIEMYGLGNWAEVAEHVGTKSKSHCICHYNTIYMNSPCFPRPDMSKVMGKNREELLAMARDQAKCLKELPTLGDVVLNDESTYSERIKVEDPRKEVPAGRSCLISEIGCEDGDGGVATSMGTAKMPSSLVPGNDGGGGFKFEDRSVGEKKPKASPDEHTTLTELCGYNPKRQEFDIEYDNDAEQLLADMEFKETDTDAEHELKLRVLRIYSLRLDERKRRKDFILERNLIYPDPLKKNLSHEEKAICDRYRIFLRFHSSEEHEELLRSLIEEQQLLKRIQDLQDARSAGCRTSADAERYIEQRRKTQPKENDLKVKDNTPAGSGGIFMQRPPHLGDTERDCSPNGDGEIPPFFDPDGKDLLPTKTGNAVSNIKDDWDVTGHLGAELLSQAEIKLCNELRVLPTHYLRMVQTLSMGISNGSITKKEDAQGLFEVEPSKVGRIYDVLLEREGPHL